MSRPAPAATRALSILDFLATRPTELFTLSEIAQHLDLNLASAHAVLNVMVDAGYLERHPSHKTYRLGPSVIAVGNAALVGHPVIQVARAEMDQLAGELDLECLAAAPIGDELVIVARAGTPRWNSPLVHVGQRLPLVPPLGVMFVAWSGDDRIQQWLSRARPFESRGHATRYRAILESARVLGYSVGFHVDGRQVAVAPVPGDPTALDLDPTQRYPVTYIAASVFDQHRRVALVINLDGFPEPLSPEEIRVLGRRLRDTAAAITQRAHGSSPSANVDLNS